MHHIEPPIRRKIARMNTPLICSCVREKEGRDEGCVDVVGVCATMAADPHARGLANVDNARDGNIRGN